MLITGHMLGEACWGQHVDLMVAKLGLGRHHHGGSGGGGGGGDHSGDAGRGGGSGHVDLEGLFRLGGTRRLLHLGGG